QLEQDHPQGELVGPSVYDRSRSLLGCSQRCQLFRRHVRKGSSQALPFPLLIEGEVKIKEHRPAGRSQQDVGRLEVSVEDLLRMNTSQGPSDLGSQVDNPFNIGSLDEDPIRSRALLTANLASVLGAGFENEAS